MYTTKALLMNARLPFRNADIISLLQFLSHLKYNKAKKILNSCLLSHLWILPISFPSQIIVSHLFSYSSCKPMYIVILIFTLYLPHVHYNVNPPSNTTSSIFKIYLDSKIYLLFTLIKSIWNACNSPYPYCKPLFGLNQHYPLHGIPQ